MFPSTNGYFRHTLTYVQYTAEIRDSFERGTMI
jgi:hypothetical protein